MNQLLALLVKTFGLKLVENRIKRQGVLLYLKTVQGVRLSFIGLIIASVLFHLMALGFIGAVIGLILLCPEMDHQMKLIMLTIGAGVLFIIPTIGLIYLLSGKTWLRASGAEKMLKDL